MTVRFDTWVEADTPREAWEKLGLALEDKRMGDKLKNEFTVTILEDGDEDKANIKGELTVREVKDFCQKFDDCKSCPLYDSECRYCYLHDSAPADWEEGYLKNIRGYKPEGEER